MPMWNALPEDVHQWRLAHSGRSVRIPLAEFGVRVKGKKPLRPPAPGELAFIAGNGRYGFNGRRYGSPNKSAIEIVQGPDGQPFAKHKRSVGKWIRLDVPTVKPRKQKSSGGIAAGLTKKELSGVDPVVERAKALLAKNARKGKRRRTQKRLRKEYKKAMLAQGLASLQRKWGNK